MVSKLSSYPKEFDIENKGTPIHGTQANVRFAVLRTKSNQILDIVTKKEKEPEYSSLNNEFKKVGVLKNMQIMRK